MDRIDYLRAGQFTTEKKISDRMVVAAGYRISIEKEKDSKTEIMVLTDEEAKKVASYINNTLFSDVAESLSRCPLCRSTNIALDKGKFIITCVVCGASVSGKSEEDVVYKWERNRY